MNNGSINVVEKECIRKVVWKMKEQYLTEKNIYVYLLSKDDKNILDRIDIILHIIETSLRFNQCRRAVRYIAVLNSLCKKYFNQKEINTKIANLDIKKRIDYERWDKGEYLKMVGKWQECFWIYRVRMKMHL